MSARGWISRGGQQGFTLTEVLIAMTLLGFLATVLFGGLTYGAQSLRGVDRASAEAQTLTRLHAFLRDRVGGRNLLIDRGAETVGFEGDADRLKFVALWSPRFAGEGPFQFTVAKGERGGLAIAWRPVAENATSIAALQSGQRSFLPGVKVDKLSYYGDPSGGAQPDWRETWTARDRAPALLRILFESGYPPLVIEIHS